MPAFLGSIITQFRDPTTDLPLAGGTVNFYEPGTTTAKNVFSTIADALANTNNIGSSVSLDDYGRATIVLRGKYRMIVKDSDGVAVDSLDIDNIDQHSNVLDANGKVLVSYTAVSSAVNYLDISNNSTGNSVILTAKGGDANVDLDIECDGTGELNINANTNITGTLTASGGLSFSGVVEIDGEAGTPAEIKLYEDTDTGLNYFSLKSPTGLSSNITALGFNALPSTNTEIVTLTTGGQLATTGFDATGLQSVQIFTSSDTWSRPTGVTKVIVEVVAGGAGGGGAEATSSGQSAIAGGGGAGGYSKALLDVTSISSSTVTVGSGGSGGTAGNNAGSNGGTSSWSDGTNTLSCSGGSGGAGGNATSSTTARAAAAGGTSSGGDLNLAGQPSSAGVMFGGSGGYSGAGGHSRLGAGGKSIAGGGSLNTAGADATGYGSGGSGGGNGASQTAVAGGAGADGIVIVWEYK